MTETGLVQKFGFALSSHVHVPNPTKTLGCHESVVALVGSVLCILSSMLLGSVHAAWVPLGEDLEDLHLELSRSHPWLS